MADYLSKIKEILIKELVLNLSQAVFSNLVINIVIIIPVVKEPLQYTVKK
jgi:hypothetical protein